MWNDSVQCEMNNRSQETSTANNMYVRTVLLAWDEKSIRPAWLRQLRFDQFFLGRKPLHPLMTGSLTDCQAVR